MYTVHCTVAGTHTKYTQPLLKRKHADGTKITTRTINNTHPKNSKEKEKTQLKSKESTILILNQHCAIID